MDAYTRRVYLARVRDFVGGLAFPSTRAEILAHVQRKNTPSDIVNDLDHLPMDQFGSLDEVVRAVDALRFGSTTR